jgi:hypothetical protein
MECSSCSKKINGIQNLKFWIKFFLRKAATCPYCRTALYAKENPTREYFKLIFFTLFFFGLALFLMAMIFSRQVGFKSAVIICFWFWIIIIAVFLSTILLNWAVIGFKRVYFGEVKKR